YGLGAERAQKRIVVRECRAVGKPQPEAVAECAAAGGRCASREDRVEGEATRRCLHDWWVALAAADLTASPRSASAPPALLVPVRQSRACRGCWPTNAHAAGRTIRSDRAAAAGRGARQRRPRRGRRRGRADPGTAEAP